MNLKDISEELSSYIADAEKLERVVEAFREMDRHASLSGSTIMVTLNDFNRLRALVDDE